MEDIFRGKSVLYARYLARSSELPAILNMSKRSSSQLAGMSVARLTFIEIVADLYLGKRRI